MRTPRAAPCSGTLGRGHGHHARGRARVAGAAPRPVIARAIQAPALRRPAGREGRRRHLLPGRGASPPAAARAQDRPRRHARSRPPPGSCPSWWARRPSSRPTSWTSTRNTWPRCGLGVMTDTQDLSGAVLETRPVPALDAPRTSSGRSAPSSARIQPGAAHVLGAPPRGRRLYELAREGVEVERKPRAGDGALDRARVLALPDFTIRVRCGKGFYVRTLAADLGRGARARRRAGRRSCAPAWARTAWKTPCRGTRCARPAAAARSGLACCRPTPALGRHARRSGCRRSRRAPSSTGSRCTRRRRAGPVRVYGPTAPSSASGAARRPRQARTAPPCGSSAASSPTRLSCARAWRRWAPSTASISPTRSSSRHRRRAGPRPRRLPSVVCTFDPHPASVLQAGAGAAAHRRPSRRTWAAWTALGARRRPGHPVHARLLAHGGRGLRGPTVLRGHPRRPRGRRGLQPHLRPRRARHGGAPDRARAPARVRRRACCRRFRLHGQTVSSSADPRGCCATATPPRRPSCLGHPTPSRASCCAGRGGAGRSASHRQPPAGPARWCWPPGSTSRRRLGRGAGTGGAADAVVNIGYRPTFGENQYWVEAYLLDFSGRPLRPDAQARVPRPHPARDEVLRAWTRSSAQVTADIASPRGSRRAATPAS